MGKTTVYYSVQLVQLLKKIYGERLVAATFDSLMGDVKGFLDSKPIFISFKGNEFLLISTSPKTKGVLDELLPILTEVMGNKI